MLSGSGQPLTYQGRDYQVDQIDPGARGRACGVDRVGRPEVPGRHRPGGRRLSRAWQLTRSRSLIVLRGGVIVAEYFDIDDSRSIPWRRRPHATALLADLRDLRPELDAVVIGEPHRAFYGNQDGLAFPLFEHHGVPLWVPEVGGPIDPANKAHDMVMSVFGGMSKAERNRIKIRVRTAMEALARMEGRFLGGRPPYGYLIADAGPHPNPAKAADGKRLHRLELDPEAAPVVRRIFALFLAGHGIYAIAEMLTGDGIPCPSAHDPAGRASQHAEHKPHRTRRPYALGGWRVVQHLRPADAQPLG